MKDAGHSKRYIEHTDTHIYIYI